MTEATQAAGRAAAKDAEEGLATAQCKLQEERRKVGDAGDMQAA